MVVVNTSGGEINAKIVYYGPALSGKTTNLQYIYEKTPRNAKGKLVSTKTRSDRTLFFDFLPLALGDINGCRIRMLLYTVPGQVCYNATRKLVLNGADAVVFVADSAADRMDDNIESLRNLEANLNEYGRSLDTLPWVIQYNKRDAPNAVSVQTFNNKLNLLRVRFFEAVATRGQGVDETFQAVAYTLYNQLVERFKAAEPPPMTDATRPGAGQEPYRTASVEAGYAPDSTARLESERSTNEQSQISTPGSPEPSSVVPTPNEPSSQEPDSDETVEDVVDFALREIDVDAAPPAGGRMPAKAPTPVQTSVATESTTGPATEAAARSPGGSTEAASPEKTATPPAVDSPERFGFEDHPETVDDDLGRLIHLEEQGGTTDESLGDEEFIVDPFSRRRPPQPREVSPIQEEARADEPVTISVPVVVSRSELKKAIPIRLEIEIEITEDG